jgi:hypothetical protein
VTMPVRRDGFLVAASLPGEPASLRVPEIAELDERRNAWKGAARLACPNDCLGALSAG